MKIILSPAKKMVNDRDCFLHKGLPVFIDKAQEILDELRAKNYAELKTIWKCSDKIAAENAERIEKMNLKKWLTPAIFAYEGIAYQYMSPHIFTEDEFKYTEDKLRILSGFYGVVKPFDGVTPYRLEMASKLKIGEHNNLYSYWSDVIAKSLIEEDNTIINLASKEYSKAVEPYFKGRFITCIFGEKKGDKIIEKATACKMARGEMVRFMAENNIEDYEEIKAFDRQNYRFSKAHSSENTFVFVKEVK